MTKRDMVRKALADGKATAKVGVPWIKEMYGVELDDHDFSMAKVAIKKQQAKTLPLQASVGTEAPVELVAHLVTLKSKYGIDKIREVLAALPK